MTANTVTTLNGLFKEVYADKVEDLVPDGVQLIRDIPFAKKSQQNGNQYHQPVILSHEHGFTYSLAAQGAFDLRSAVAATHKDAVVTGAQVILESQLDYESAARASGDARAFKKATSHVVENMMKSIYKRLEIEHFWGGNSTIYSGLGRVDAISGTSTARVLTVKTGDWAPGIWAGAEGATVALYDNDGGGAGIPGTGLAGHTTDAAKVCTITSVQPAATTITVLGNATELGNLDTAVAAGDTFLYWGGAFGKEFTGAVEVARNTGTLFGVAGGTYGLWQGNSYSASSAALTFAKLLDGHDSAVGKGLSERVCVYLNPKTWTDIMTDLAALRRFDSSYKSSGKNGFESVEFASQFGSIELKPSIYMKESQALSLAPSQCKRLGATDVTFNVPGMEKEEFLYQLATKAGYGVRAYTNQAFFSKKPACNTHFINITNS